MKRKIRGKLRGNILDDPEALRDALQGEIEEEDDEEVPQRPKPKPKKRIEPKKVQIVGRREPKQTSGFGVADRSQWDEWSWRLAKTIRRNASRGRIAVKNPMLKIDSWPGMFKELCRTIPQRCVAEVLDWYCKHLGDEFVPVCLSAGTFCKRFKSIEAAMRRMGPETEDVEITETALWIQEHLGLRWPTGNREKQDELWTIQVTLNRVRAYHRKLKSMLETYRSQYEEFRKDYFVKDGKPLVPSGKRRDYNTPLRKYCILEIMSGFEPEQTTIWWMDKVHEMAWHWKGWDGNLRAWAWRTDVKIFLNAERDRMRDEGHGCKEWKEMMAEAGYPIRKQISWEVGR